MENYILFFVIGVFKKKSVFSQWKSPWLPSEIALITALWMVSSESWKYLPKLIYLDYKKTDQWFLQWNTNHIYFPFWFSGQKTLLSCLYDFLKQEKLEGDNQYYCNGCESKQDATRCVRLSQLPPVLNLQLNRFIFDMNTGRKKKLNSFVHFPEVLEMAAFLRQPSSDDNTFHLTGVLMHVGKIFLFEK